jgi:hypothetical protein
MGTDLRVEFIRDENTTKKQWNTLQKFLDKQAISYDIYIGDAQIETEIIHRSYRNASASDILLDISDDLIGSGIVVNVWYEERDPDDTYCFEERV